MTKRRRARGAVELPHGVHRVIARAREYFYYQPGRGTKFAGERIKLPSDPRAPEFWTALRQAQGIGRDTTPTDTLGALVDAYMADWPKLRRPIAETTQKQYRGQLNRARRMWGELPAKGLKPVHVQQAMDRMKPGTANNFLGVMWALSKWARGKGLIDASLTEGVQSFAAKGGHKPWTEEQIGAAHEHLTGDVRKGVMLEMCTGQRGSDMVRMRPTMPEKDGSGFDLGWRGQQKTGVRPWCPVLPELAREMATPLWKQQGELGPYVRGPSGRPFTRDGFGREFAKAKAELAGRGITALEGTTLHGLRGTACVYLRRAGFDNGTIAGMVGMSVRMVERYTRFEDKRITGKAAVARIAKNETAPG